MSDFWARRKQAVAEEAAADLRVEEEIAAVEAEEQLAERSDEEILAELDLPVPEELDSAEAVRNFLSSAVPQRLKTRALRRLWTLNPMLANLDGLIDYGEDFTDSATVLENLQTAYQVGKGMLQHVEELARADADVAEETPLTDDHDEASGDQEPVAPAVDEAATDFAAADDTPAAIAPVIAAQTMPEDVDPVLPSAPRRMQFRFEEPA